MSKPIKIIVADNDDKFVTNLITYLQSHPTIQIIGVAIDGPGILELYQETWADVVIVSLKLPIVDGIRITQALLKHNAQLGVLVLAPIIDNDYVLEAMKRGARGYLAKTVPLTAIVRAIEVIYKGSVYFPAELAMESEQLTDEQLTNEQLSI